MAKSNKSWLQRFKESEASTSVVFGAIVVIVVGILLFNYSKANPSILNQGEATISATITSSTGEQLPTTYEVKPGDNLWMIAEKYYGDGFRWVDLAQNNNLSASGAIEIGQVLNIPVLESKLVPSPTAEVTDNTENKTEKDVSASHVVTKGDCLWNIAVKAYGNGYRWVDIYQANRDVISNPDLIYPGQVLRLP